VHQQVSISIEKEEWSLEKTNVGSSPEDTKGKVVAPIQPTTTLSRMAHAKQGALATTGESPIFHYKTPTF